MSIRRGFRLEAWEHPEPAHAVHFGFQTDYPNPKTQTKPQNWVAVKEPKLS